MRPRLRTTADGRPPAPYSRGSEVMYKVMFAALLAAGLVAAPVPQSVSTASAQQQLSRQRKRQSQKKNQAPDNSPRANGQRSTVSNGRKPKLPEKSKREQLGRNSGVTVTSGSKPPRNNFSAHAERQANNKKFEGVGETLSLADALDCHRNRGAAGQPHCARYSMTHTGPYDAISDT